MHKLTHLQLFKSAFNSLMAVCFRYTFLNRYDRLNIFRDVTLMFLLTIQVELAVKPILLVKEKKSGYYELLVKQPLKTPSSNE